MVGRQFVLIHLESEGQAATCPQIATISGDDISGVEHCQNVACHLAANTINIREGICEIRKCSGTVVTLDTDWGHYDIYTLLGKPTCKIQLLHYKVEA